MAELVGGAALGTVFGGLFKAVWGIKGRAFMFKQSLAYLKTTLITIAPLIKEIEQHNNDLRRPKEELESLIREMEKVTELVLKYSKTRRINLIARARNQKQLEALGDSLVMFFLIDLAAHTARDQKEALIKINRLLSTVNKMQLVNRDETSGGFSDSESYYSTATHLAPENEDGTDSAELQQVEEITFDELKKYLTRKMLKQQLIRPVHDRLPNRYKEILTKVSTDISKLKIKCKTKIRSAT